MALPQFTMRFDCKACSARMVEVENAGMKMQVDATGAVNSVDYGGSVVVQDYKCTGCDAGIRVWMGVGEGGIKAVEA